jgi:hypothetical protein
MRIASNPTPYRVSKEQLQSIPCPNLRTLVNEGWLTPDKDGIVDIKQLDEALKRLGTQGLPHKILTRGAEAATKEVVAQQLGDAGKGKFNIFRLTGSTLDHKGDTRVLRDGFNAERMEWLLSFANKDGRIGIAEASRAQKAAADGDPLGASSFRDRGLGVAELVAIVKVYGTVDKNGQKSISVEGARNLWEHSKFPDEWKAQLDKAGGVNPAKTGLLSLLSGVVEMAFRQIGMTSGRARVAMDMALGRDPQLNQTSAMGLAASVCPAGPPVAMAKKQVDQSHAA